MVFIINKLINKSIRIFQLISNKIYQPQFIVLRLASKHSRGEVKMIAGTQTQYRIKIRFTYQLRIKIQNGGSLKAKKASIHKYNFFYWKKSINWDSAWCLRQRTNKVSKGCVKKIVHKNLSGTSGFFRLDTVILFYGRLVVWLFFFFKSNANMPAWYPFF